MAGAWSELLSAALKEANSEVLSVKWGYEVTQSAQEGAKESCFVPKIWPF